MSKKRVVSFVAGVLGVLAVGSVSAHGQAVDLDAPHHPEHLLVRFNPEVSDAAIDVVNAAIDAELLHKYRFLSGLVLVRVPEARLADANKHFETAIQIFQRFKLVWQEARALEHWGDALRSAGDQAGAAQKFDGALEIYRRIGAGSPWLEKVLARKEILKA